MNLALEHAITRATPADLGTNARKRGLYQPYTNIVYGGGCALGAALGGVMAETLGWRWEFGVQVPFLLLCIGISSVVIPDGMGLRGPSKGAWNAIKEFDGRGSVLLATATTALILGLSLGGNTLPWSHPAVVALLAAFAVCIPTFLWVESRCANPVVPLNLLFKPPRSNLLFANFIAAMLTHSILFNMPLFYQAVLLTSASSSGLRLMVPSMVASVVSAVTGPSIAWSRRLKWPLVSGVTCYVCGTLCLCFLHRDVPSTLSIVALVPFAVGQGFLFPGTFIAMLATSEQSELAVATTTLLLWRSLGMVVGIAGSSVVVQNALLHYLDVFVQGGGKSRVISQVRASVEAVALLESPYREQAIHSYESALRVTFVGCAVMAAAAALLISPIKLPRLGAK
ncbi:hypothetical protein PLIIFM63780_006537 [Purpureocillium lilacinum]|nr:hypothetical protein PLIIFM63780_006537 [Purpureocillium lilacinum]